MRTLVASEPGTVGKPNEDAAGEHGRSIVVADGATARTNTGCIHGVAWFSRHLVEATLAVAESLQPKEALAAGIQATADAHRATCNLSDIATPSAAIAMVQYDRGEVRFLLLGDVTIVFEHDAGISVVVDDRVDRTARTERATADALKAGSVEKNTALVAMKHAELAARNVDGGFWVAAADTAAVSHALTWSEPRARLRRIAIVTDGAARLVKPFGLLDWSAVLDILAKDGGQETLIRMVRDAEASDPEATRWPRNKISDDATIAYLEFG